MGTDRSSLARQLTYVTTVAKQDITANCNAARGSIDLVATIVVGGVCLAWTRCFDGDGDVSCRALRGSIDLVATIVAGGWCN